jgi:crotonobetainyl-CoA:carnitine CoA-transferase CaiB-like acyl-CoA transferase
MMGGLAYMTGPEDRPLRAGTSVNDIMGGIFGAIGVMAALRQRDISGEGQEVQSSLFENNVFLVGQHMMQYAVTGNAAKPMPSRISAWAIYDVFEVESGEKIFLAVVSDTQWKIFCDAFGFNDLYEDPELKLNNQRVQARETLIPEVRKRLAHFSAKQLSDIFEKHGLPYAPITRPEQLFDDPHLNATGGLAPIKITDGPKAGVETKTPLLPILMGGKRLGIRRNPPTAGQQSQEILLDLGYDEEQISNLVANGSVNIEAKKKD